MFEISVNQYNGHDCWRTWFIEECETAELFGTTIGHISYIQGVQYQAGTIMYFEDAPYFHEIGIHHRICGPYIVVATTQLPPCGKSIYINNNKIIAYKEPRPKLGPWFNHSKARIIEGVKVHFKQMASSYDYFPLRFKIKRGKDFKSKLITHEVSCKLCSKPYDSSVFNKRKSVYDKPRTKLIKKRNV